MNHIFRLLTLTLALSGPLDLLQAQAPVPNLEILEERAFKQAAAFINPSIVRIETVGGQDRVGKLITGTGPTSGVIVSRDGLIISSAFNFNRQALFDPGDLARWPTFSGTECCHRSS